MLGGMRIPLLILLILALVLLGPSGAVAGPSLQEDMPDEPSAAEEDSRPAEEAPPPAEVPPAVDTSRAQVGPDPSIPWWQWRTPPEFSTQFPAMFEYGEFWKVRSEILAHPNDLEAELRLPTIMGGEALAAEEKALNELKTADQAQIVIVENNPVVAYASESDFVIYDTYVSRSYLVDARTGAALGDGPNVAPSSLTMAYRMQKGKIPQMPDFEFWRVVDSVRIVNP
jgi:hypothetical protein